MYVCSWIDREREKERERDAIGAKGDGERRER